MKNRTLFGVSAAVLAGTVLILAQPPGGRPPAPAPPPQPGPGASAPAPGPRIVAQPVAGLTPAELALFNEGRQAFADTEGVADGVGPRFNLDSCVGCHAAPTIGGTSPGVNPQVAVASRMGARNTIPPFITQNGPVRVLRLKRDANGNPDGGVHALFTITGRTDAPAGCQLTQPDFSNPNNHALRIPTPVFGGGLIEAIPDSTLRANLAASRVRGQTLGIGGRLNTNGNDGTVTRFGWKAQNKSLEIFSGEAYNVEMGVTNVLFPQEREENPNCATNATPEDRVNVDTNGPSDMNLFTHFMRFLAPTPTGTATAATERGRAAFERVGCNVCHTPTLRTGNSATAALRNKDANLYSDLALHRMGAALDDDVVQGAARGQDWRTAPLWGVGSRLFFLHDGRTSDLNQAILQHASPGSEANQVIGNYNALTATERQELLAFLLTL